MNTARISLVAAFALTISTFAYAAPGAAQGTKPISFGKTKTYTYDKNLFSIEYPSTWKVDDRTDEAEGDVVVQFTDKTGFAALRVDVGETSEAWTSAELASGLTRIMKNRYSEMKKYSASAAKKIGAAQASLTFKFEYDKTAMTGDAIMSYHPDNRVAVVAVVMPTDQYAKNKKAALALLESFRMASSGSELITDLEAYEHPNGAFAISYPVGWSIDDRSESDGEVVVVFENPEGVSFVMVEVYKSDGEDLTKDEVIAKLEETVATAIEKNVENYEAKDAKGIDDDTASKTFTFTITDADDNEIPVVGVMVLQEHGDAYSYIRVVLPQDVADANSDKLDEIGDSFKVDPSAEF